MEKLNITELLKQKSSSKDSIIVDTKWKTLLNGDSFFYYKKDLVNETSEIINGNETSGFVRRIKSLDSEFEEYRAYYPSGNLKKEGRQYIGKPKLSSLSVGVDARREIFKTGIWYEYDEKENISNQVNYDELFEFSIVDVKSLIDNEGLKLVPNANAIRRATSNEENVTKGKWIVLVFSNKDGYNFQQIKIDGKTGELKYGDHIRIRK